MKNSTLFAGLRLCMGYHFPLVIFAGETLWWCNSASQPTFSSRHLWYVFGLATRSLVEHAGDTSQCATMNLCCCCCRMHLELFLLEWSLLPPRVVPVPQARTPQAQADLVYCTPKNRPLCTYKCVRIKDQQEKSIKFALHPMLTGSTVWAFHLQYEGWKG